MVEGVVSMVESSSYLSSATTTLQATTRATTTQQRVVHICCPMREQARRGEPPMAEETSTRDELRTLNNQVPSFGKPLCSRGDIGIFIRHHWNVSHLLDSCIPQTMKPRWPATFAVRRRRRFSSLHTLALVGLFNFFCGRTPYN